MPYKQPEGPIEARVLGASQIIIGGLIIAGFLHSFDVVNDLAHDNKELRGVSILLGAMSLPVFLGGVLISMFGVGRIIRGRALFDD